MALATDKQIKYLHSLQDRVMKIQNRAKAYGHNAYRELPPFYDYYNERNCGMTVADASVRIAAWRRLVVYGNATLALFNIEQV